MEPKNKNSYQYQYAKKRVKKIKGFYIHLLVYLFINIALIIIGSREHGIVSGLKDPGNYITALFWGIGLVFHWWNVFGPNLFFGKEWEEKKIRQIIDRNKERTWE